MVKEFIEREKALSNIDKAFKMFQDHDDMLRLYSDTRLAVIVEPAADVAEVRHGRWEAWMPDKNGETREFICTGCRFMVEMSWKQKECDYEWCPYCGCKMDKEVTDDKKQPEEAPGE